MASGQQKPLKTIEKQMTGIDQPKPQQQLSQQISGIGQQDPKQKQSQQGLGNAKKETKFVDFDYEQFLQIMKQGLQKHEENQENSQQKLLNKFRCMIVSHKNKSIEGICVNEECKAPNRRMCFDCIRKGEHALDKNGQQLQLNQPLYEDELKYVIEDYRLLVNKRIDYFQYVFYYEQLEVSNESDEKIACFKMNELDKIDHQIKYLQERWDQINIKGYIQQQHDTNLGIFNYFQQYYKEIIEIDENIYKYYQLKSDMGNQNQMEQFKINPNPNQIEGFDSLKKKKQIMIHKIKETQMYKNEEIDQKEQSFIKQQIEEIAQQEDVFHKHKQQEQVLSIPNDLQDAYYYSQKGDSLYWLKRYEEAIQMYDKAINLKPQNPNLYSMKGFSLQNLQRYEEAIQMFDKAINLNPQNPNFYSMKGFSLQNIQRYEEAIQMFDKAINLNPQNPNFYSMKGFSLQNIQRYEEAIQMFDKAINLNPQNPYYYLFKGISLQNLKRYEEAQIMFEKANQIKNA